MPLFAERKSGGRIYGAHGQTETNPAQLRERLDDRLFGKPVRGEKEKRGREKEKRGKEKRGRVRVALHALYLDRSRDARPLPRGFTGHVAHPLRSILHRGLPGALLCTALGKPGRLLRKPLRESPAAPSPALRPMTVSALAAW